MSSESSESQEQSESYIAERFFDKLRKNASRVPFVEEAVTLYFCATDPGTPTWAKAASVAALVYFIVPLDLLPDPIFIDDAAVIAVAIKQLSTVVTDEHRSQARRWLHGEQLDGQEMASEAKDKEDTPAEEIEGAEV
jgi:uncharacterized membrane protein YkvA (DUF1232 family)